MKLYLRSWDFDSHFSSLYAMEVGVYYSHCTAMCSSSLSLTTAIPKPMKIGIIAIILMVSSGCVAMNTFQTPAVLEPGKAMLLPGAVVPISGGPTEDANLPKRESIQFGQALQISGRVGVLPHLDMGVHMIGLGAVALDAKVGTQHGPFLLAGNAGLGVGGHDASGLTGYQSRATRTFFGGIVLGYRGAYAGVKVIDYHFRKVIPEEPTQRYDRVIPGIGFGYMGGKQGRAKPIFEINRYHFPGEVVYTMGMGVQIPLGE